MTRDESEEEVTPVKGPEEDGLIELGPTTMVPYTPRLVLTSTSLSPVPFLQSPSGRRQFPPFPPSLYPSLSP